MYSTAPIGRNEIQEIDNGVKIIGKERRERSQNELACMRNGAVEVIKKRRASKATGFKTVRFTVKGEKYCIRAGEAEN